MPGSTLTEAWIAVQAASAAEQSAARALDNEEQTRRSQRALVGLTKQHDAAMVVLDDALKALAMELAKASKKETLRTHNMPDTAFLVAAENAIGQKP
jgi:hypothetical protein